MKTNQKGFSAVEIILVIVVVGLIGVVGFMVYKNHNKTTSNSTATTTNTPATSTAQPTAKTTTPKEISDDWLEYKAPHYSVKFADGWVITKKQGDGSGLFTTNNNDLTYKAGQKAVVKDYTPSGPGEFTYGLFIDYNDASSNTGKCTDYHTDSPLTLAFKTDSGDSVYKQTATGGDGSPSASNLSKGDKYYGYCVQLGASTLNLGYTLASGSKDNSSTIEQVLKTVKSL